VVQAARLFLEGERGSEQQRQQQQHPESGSGSEEEEAEAQEAEGQEDPTPRTRSAIGRCFESTRAERRLVKNRDPRSVAATPLCRVPVCQLHP
jgi:hypothetical protein